MVERVKTIQTQGFQLWLNRTLSECGWELDSPILGAYVEPIDTWADMTHLLAVENWPEAQAPKQVAYFVGVMKDDELIPGPEDRDFPGKQNDRARLAAVNFLESAISYLWPSSADQGTKQFNWQLLCPSCRDFDSTRFSSQYWRANIDPSERYTLAVAGSTQYRLRTDSSGYSNLVLTGDWLRNGLNTPGCIESAVISGRQAARAISGGRKRIIGETDFPRSKLLEWFLEITATFWGFMRQFLNRIMRVFKD